ncbi:MAG: hypothetical protein WC787_01835 [Patescibacteria group bacterium]
MKKSNGGPKKPRAGSIDNEILKQHAKSLARVLFALHKDDAELTSDKLWGLIKSYWSEAKLIDALKAAKKRDLKKFRELLAMDPEKFPKAGADGFIEIDGKKWGTAGALASFLDLSSTALIPRIKNLFTRSGVDRSNRVGRFYRLSDVEKSCADLLDKTLLQAGLDGFVQIDGEKWGTLVTIATLLGKKVPSIVPHCKSLEWVKAKDRGGRVYKFYRLSLVAKACTELLDKGIPQASADGLVTLGKEKWGSIRAIGKYLGLSDTGIAARVKGLASRHMRDRAKRVKPFYRLSDIEKVYAHLLDKTLVKVDSDGFIEIDGEIWGSVRASASHFELSRSTILAGVGGLITKRAKDGVGNIVTIHRLSDIEKVYARLLDKTLVKVGLDGFAWIDGEKWATVAKMSRVLCLDQGSLALRVKNLRTRQAKIRVGRRVTVYRLSDVEKSCADLLLEKGRRRNPITRNELKAHATQLARVIMGVHKKIPSVTSDNFFAALMKRWSKADLTEALSVFQKRKSLAPFLALMKNAL